MSFSSYCKTVLVASLFFLSVTPNLTHIPNMAPPKWAAWSKNLHPRTTPMVSMATMAFRACGWTWETKDESTEVEGEQVRWVGGVLRCQRWRWTWGGRWWPVWLQAFWCKQQPEQSWWLQTGRGRKASNTCTKPRSLWHHTLGAQVERWLSRYFILKHSILMPKKVLIFITLLYQSCNFTTEIWKFSLTRKKQTNKKK